MATPASTKEPQSNIEWRLFGKLDVGVSHDYAAGLAEWSTLRGHAQHFGLARWETACEIGCGAGRLTNAVALDFREVHALDVSAERIAQARSAPNTANCNFHQVHEPRIPLPDAYCDLVYSAHVFQHFSSNAIVDAYFREAARVLRPGGVLMVHMPMVGAHGRTGELGETLARTVKEVVKETLLALLRPAIRLGLKRPPWAIATYRVFSFVRVAKELGPIGFQNVELRILPYRGHHSYVLAARI